MEHDSRAISGISHGFEPANAVSFFDFFFPDFAFAKSNPCEIYSFVLQLFYLKVVFQFLGALRGYPPQKG